MTLFSGQIYGGVGQLGAHNKAGVVGDILIFNDTFTGVDGTALPAHAPELGGPWAPHGYNAVITSGKATGKNASNALSLAKSNIKITADITVTTSSSTPSISFRVKTNDANDYKDCYYVKFNAYQSRLTLFETIGGTIYTRANSACAFVNEGTYAAEIIADGDNISVTCNGVTLTYSSSSNKTGTYLYFYFDSFCAGNFGIDNLKIYDLGE